MVLVPIQPMDSVPQTTLGLVAHPVTLVTPHSARGQLEITSLHVACVLKGTIPAMVMLQEWVLDAYRVPSGIQQMVLLSPNVL